MIKRWRGSLFLLGRIMVIYSLQPSAQGQWDVCRAGASLFSELPLPAAIPLARELARDEFLRCGGIVCVEMPGTESTIRLAQFARSDSPLVQAA